MKKVLLYVILVVAVIAALVWLFRPQLLDFASEQLAADMFVPADTASFDPGLPVGAEVPPVRALYDGREITDLAPLSGPRGLVLVANRSADWCPYCMAQFVQLNEQAAAFRAAGIALVALTYDAPELQQRFVARHDISYPFLSDVAAHTVQALGILNEEYAPGDSAYGIPHPGVFVISPQGEIVGKLFIDGYQRRVDAAAVLAYADTRLD